MKVEMILHDNGKNCDNCNWDCKDVFRLDGWDNDDVLCGHCFVRELAEQGYNIYPKKS